MAGICPCTMGNSISAALSNLRNVKRLNTEEPEQTAPATVLSRSVQHRNAMYQDSPWLYLVRFRLEKGEELQLNATEEAYQQLTEGRSGTLTWREDTLLSFC